ncbi:pentapeptide repeat-containing protein [Bacillus pumilus]|uniref:pentapeptide repeat-containing protein n=1 Tax=Bacillus pumilus TaxID=1408 RepID=UPI003F429F9B
MRRVESGISIDNETFSDVTRYENETISRTTIINSNVRSPIFWSCHLDHLVIDTCDLTNARFFAGSTIDHCTFAGKLIDITFEGNGKQKLIADFEYCTLDGVRFIGCDLSACNPPAFKNHLYVENVSERVKKALEKIDDDPTLSDDDRKILVRSLRKLEQMEQYIFNTKHMEKIYGPAFVERFFSHLGCSKGHI